MAESLVSVDVVADGSGPVGTRELRVGSVVAAHTAPGAPSRAQLTMETGRSFLVDGVPATVAASFSLVSLPGVGPAWVYPGAVVEVAADGERVVVRLRGASVSLAGTTLADVVSALEA